jgi:hypothetical protein
VLIDLGGHVDAGSLLGEINAVFKKYGVGKGVGFVPDRLEIVMNRSLSGACTLVYREFFNYLPSDVMELATGNAVEFLGGLGVPRESIKMLDGGVEVTLKGDARIAYFPMLEMLIQDKGVVGSVDSALDGLKTSIKSLMELFDFAYGWDAASESLWRSNVERLGEIIEANPGMQAEIDEIVKRHGSGG